MNFLSGPGFWIVLAVSAVGWALMVLVARAASRMQQRDWERTHPGVPWESWKEFQRGTVRRGTDST